MAASIKLASSSVIKQRPLLSSSMSASLRGEQRQLRLSPALRQKKVVSCSRRWVAAAVTEVAERLVEEKTGWETEEENVMVARASVLVRRKKKEEPVDIVLNQLDACFDKIGMGVALELISTEINYRTGGPNVSKPAELKGWFEKKDVKAEQVIYTAEFVIDSSFGIPGAIAVVNRHQKEFFLESIVVEGFAGGAVHFTCNSWVQPIRIHSNKRIFFSNKPYLPSETPLGLRKLREMELKELRGDGKGERKLTDRVYDYATYNDLGNPDKGVDFVRPHLGGEKMPYPRRLRTGRSPTETDSSAESRVEDPLPIYVPCDDEFEEGKQEMISEGATKAVLHNFLPMVVSSMLPEIQDFRGFHDIDNLFKEGLRLKQTVHDHLLNKLPFLSKIQNSSEGLLRYETPVIITKDKFAWLRDDEFARQTLAGINPVNIERLQAFPPASKLDPAIYGSPESAIREEHIIGHIDGMSVKQALEQNKLYILDFHDAYLPFIDKINSQDGRKAYATRTIFFLTKLGTLKPIAIELCLPKTATPQCKRAKRVFTPPSDSTSTWLWQLAKAHVCSNDAGVHQLVNHWLRTHACVEPFIIAAHRQLSAMHPISKLLKPHMRYTLKINALARQMLINGGGIIESGFTPGKYCMEISAAAYRHWRLDQESLPADLIRRGMAVKDSTKPHGLRLLIEDYPYAADGLLLWSAIEKWVRKYVDYYYPNADAVCVDAELQSWYAEAVHVGHADKRTAAGWLQLATPADLGSLLSTLIWLSSAQHAALNFGQYPLGGYIPNRPPLMRRLVPAEDDAEYAYFLADPQRFFLSALPSLPQTTTFMTVIDTLSTHSVDEEYLGDRSDPETWTADEEMITAANEFQAEVRRAEKEMARRNSDAANRNRCGAGTLKYELMSPSSGPGITCRGVPNSITI